MNGNLIKNALLLWKPRFTNANNACPAHQNPQRQVKSSKPWRPVFLTFSWKTSTRKGREEWLTRAINYLKSYPDISEATCVNLYKKLPTEARIFLDVMRGTATLQKAEKVLQKKYASSQMCDVQVALSGMHLASHELPSEMLRKTLQKAHLSVPIMNKGLDMLVKVLFSGVQKIVLFR